MLEKPNRSILFNCNPQTLKLILFDYYYQNSKYKNKKWCEHLHPAKI